MKKILVTGGSGMVGQYLTRKCIEKGYSVNWLSRKLIRSKTEGVNIFQWNVEKFEIDLKAFENVEYLIHLAGAGIADKRWSKEYKKTIIESRVKSAELIVKSIVHHNIQIKNFVGASAVGYFGMESDDKIYSEVDEKGNDFLSDVCYQWESAYLPLADKTQGLSIVRIGLVLSNAGGIYSKLKPVFEKGLGSAIGSGKQYMPWIHIEDLCNLIIFLIEHGNGCEVFNAVSDETITNYEFSKKLAQSLNVPFFMPNIPEWILKIIFGEQYKMLTTGLKISNKKIKEKGFIFQYDTLEKSFDDLKKKKDNGE